MNVFGKFLTSIGKVNLPYSNSNLIIIKVGEQAKFPALVQQCSVNSRDRIQVVPCFNDAIQLYSFGKEPRTISIQGIVLSQDVETVNSTYQNSYRSFKQSPVKIIVSSIAMEGYAISLSINTSAELACFSNFSMEFIEKS